MAEAQSKGSSIARQALAPLAHAAVTAGSAYLMRKALRLWEEKLQPKIKQRGGRALATEAKEAVKSVAEKAGAATSSESREAQRRQREQRRNQRRRALEKSGSS